MDTSLLEIIEITDGEIVLQRADDESAPLLTISFSEESRSHLAGHCLQIAQAMIRAGIEKAAELNGYGEEDLDIQEEAHSARVLH